MTTEQKAIAYDEAIERAKKVNRGEADDREPGTSICEYIFPVLKESEDERIRKNLITFFQRFPYERIDVTGTKVKEAIAWLEKQGEQKPAVIIPKFRIGDEIKTINEEPLTITKIDEKGYWSGDLFICGFDDADKWELVKQNTTDKVGPKFHKGWWIVWQDKCYKVNYNGCGYELIDQNGLRTSLEYGTVDKSAHLWTIQDAKKGDVLASELTDTIMLYKGIEDNNIQFYCDYDFSDIDVPGDRFAINNGQHYGSVDDSDDWHPVTKEQRDLLFQKMKESGYEWDAEKKELKKIEDEEYNGEDYGIDGLWHAMNILEKTLGKVSGYQTDDGFLSHQCAITTVKKLYKQKPVWSEETDNDAWMNDIISKVENNLQLNKAEIDWLKSLRPQPKQEWSKWDESYLSTTIAYLKDAKDFKKTAENCINWIKSLKQRIGG